MFCNNCGKQIPDNSKYCPYCGTAINYTLDNSNKDANGAPTKATTNAPVDHYMNDGKIHLGNKSYDAKEFLKLEKPSKFFKAVAIVCAISIFIYFGLCALIAVFNGGGEENASAIGLKITLISSIIYSILFIGVIAASIAVIAKYKKFTIGFNTMIIFKSILIAIVFIFVIMAILMLSNPQKGNLFIGTVVVCGLCFFMSGVNTSFAFSCVVKKRYFDLAREVVKKSSSITH